MKPSQKQSLALLITFLVYVASPILTSLVPTVWAGSLTSANVTINDSRAGQSAQGHTFNFTPASTTAIKTVLMQYCTTASGSCTAPSGMVLTASPTLGTVTGIDGTGYAATATSSNCTGTGNTDCTITLTVTSPATQTVQAVAIPVTAGITNPTTVDTTYFVRLTTRDTGPTTIDTATVAFAILQSDSITVTASVDPTFTFSVAAVNSGGSVNGATTNVTTTATTVPFATLSSATPKIAAHDLTVTTNATSGYVLTIKSSDPPLADGSKNIDVFTGTNASPATWSSPAGSSASVNTGFFGYTTNDATLCTGTTDRFTSSGGNKWAGSSTSALEVACSTTSVSSQTTRVGWQTEINAVQPPGSYSGVVTLVATPTY